MQNRLSFVFLYTNQDRSLVVRGIVVAFRLRKRLGKRFTANPAEELYDLTKDPHEMENLAFEPSHASQVARMRTLLNDWLTRTGDKGAIDESQAVDIIALKEEKLKWFANTMKKRGLNSNTSHQEFLKWWTKELGLK